MKVLAVKLILTESRDAAYAKLSVVQYTVTTETDLHHTTNTDLQAVRKVYCMTIPCIVSCPLNDLLVAKTSGRCRLTKKLKKQLTRIFSLHFILSVDGAMYS